MFKEQGRDIEELLGEAHLRLRDERIKAKLTQKYVEEQTGIKQPLLSAFEAGKRELSVRDILALCTLYKCSIGFIFGAEPAESAAAEIKQGSLKDALFLEQLLSQPLDENERAICDTFMILALYKVIRALYTANPRHKSTRLFETDDGQVSLALKASLEEIEGELSKRLSSKPASAKRIEAGAEYSAILREFIRDAEKIIRHAPDDI